MVIIKRTDGKIIAESKDKTFVQLVEENKNFLRNADLRDAYLRNANLVGVNLGGANLRDAYLRNANLDGADLSGANLGGANLRNAYLRNANLVGVNLSDAYLRDAYLGGANLRDVNLDGADLSGANLSGAKRYKWILSKTPIQVLGLKYNAIIFDEHMEIGCEKHSFEDWQGFTDKQIIGKGGKEALEFWKENKEILMSICNKRKEDKK